MRKPFYLKSCPGSITKSCNSVRLKELDSIVFAFDDKGSHIEYSLMEKGKN